MVIFVAGKMTLLLPVLKHDHKVAWSLAPFFRLTLSDIKSKSISCLVVSNSCDSCDPVECSPPGLSVHGILQARILEWVAIPFSRGSSQPRDRTHVSHIAGRFYLLSHQKWSEMKSISRVWLIQTPWTVANQSPPSMRFSRRGYWSRLPFPSPLSHQSSPQIQ